MGLFSKFRAKDKSPVEREIAYNKEVIQKNLDRCRSGLYDYRNDESHAIFVRLLQSMADLEMLELTTTKELSGEAYAYHRGRIDAIRAVLSLRTKYILDRDNAKKTKENSRGPDHEAKRTYMKPPTSAGLAI